MVRACQTLSATLVDARDKYLGVGEEDAMKTAPRPAS